MSDLTVDFGSGSFPEDVYTWPTALVSVKDVYNLTASIEGATDPIIALDLQVQSDDGVIDNWDMR